MEKIIPFCDRKFILAIKKQSLARNRHVDKFSMCKTNHYDNTQYMHTSTVFFNFGGLHGKDIIQCSAYRNLWMYKWKQN